MKPTPWPTRADGSPMTLGEMTPAQRHEQAAAACRRVQRQFDNPAVRAQIAAALAKIEETK